MNVQKSEFRHARIGKLEVTVDVQAGGSTLRLKGAVSNGSYKPDSGIFFNAGLEVTEDFTWQKGPVSVTLKAGPAAVSLHSSPNKHWIMVRQPGSPALKIEIEDEDEES